MRIAFLGLGNMGEPMARNLVRAGHEVIVWNRTRSRADELQTIGATIAESPAKAAAGAEVAVTMLSDDSALETVVLGPSGVAESLPKGALHISMSTISPALSQRLAAAHRDRGQEYVAAPVFGRPEAAAGAKLFVVVRANALASIAPSRCSR